MHVTTYGRKLPVTRAFTAALLAGLALLLTAGLAAASVGLVYFNLDAGPGSNQVTVSWQTETETDIVAFRVKRGTTGDPNLAVTVRTEQAQGSATSGATYSFVDTVPAPATRYFYWLIQVTSSGQERVLSAKSILLPGGAQDYRLLLPVLLHSS